ncbi:Hypothetical predicted protein [Lecanosticta acicola]|uniref:Carboxylic ester hydrolase n=1 Tax=Lecanosticta acicola TaxID=111012 RepID=A0AAI9EBK8_9PEZI|nr:Hypothetical predicted protein [Lecanosticta acicola]
MSLICTLGAALCSSLQGIVPSIPGVTTVPLPVVDLGYNLQQATSYNLQYDLYLFYDVRYAAPPTGPNRFRAPQDPVTNRSSVQTGGSQWACPQAVPKWQSIPSQFFPQYENGTTNFTQGEFQETDPPTSPQYARETEDCLFLDLYVPRSVYQNAAKPGAPSIPVVVQIYGGGFIQGAKDLNPGGWFVRDKEQGGNGIIFVSINYRLGAFGWLAGSTLQKNGDANAGLLDQHFALQWVQKYVSKFGGDPNNVTVIGESAGGGSIMHQITASGGSSNAPAFNKAIVQSPGFHPIDQDSVNEATFQAFLDLLNVSTIADARQLSFDDVYAANARQVGNAPYGQFVYGPAVDGTFVPGLPSQLLEDGKFHKNVTVMVGHNADEGILFTNPYVQNDTAFLQDVGSWMPPQAATNTSLAYINSTLYPPVFDGTHNYTNQIARTAFAISELVFTCNTFYLDKAFNNQTHAYLFAVPPAYHGLDVGYTYYTDLETTDPSTQVAVNMQRYFLHFVKTGNPNGADEIFNPWSEYGIAATEVVFNTTGNLRLQRDETANGRCNWWQENL